MFAALTAVRLREAVDAADSTLLATKAWMSPDDVQATDLPLARATEKTLASMHAVLVKTAEARARELGEDAEKPGDDDDDVERKARHLRQTRASEVRVVACVEDLRVPPRSDAVRFEAVAVDVADADAGEESRGVVGT